MGRGWCFVRSNTKNAKSLFSSSRHGVTNFIVKIGDRSFFRLWQCGHLGTPSLKIHDLLSSNMTNISDECGSSLTGGRTCINSELFLDFETINFPEKQHSIFDQLWYDCHMNKYQYLFIWHHHYHCIYLLVNPGS